MTIDPVTAQMDVIARCLEGLGYGVEVLYPEAKIIVWLEEWPVLIEGRRRKAASSEPPICPTCCQSLSDKAGAADRATDST